MQEKASDPQRDQLNLAWPAGKGIDDIDCHRRQRNAQLLIRPTGPTNASRRNLTLPTATRKQSLRQPECVMSRNQIFGILLALVAMAAPDICLAQATATVDSSSIASGKPVWVASDKGKSPINASVDIGDIQQIGDELNVNIRWPYNPAANGSEQEEQDRVICHPDHAISYAINDGFVEANEKYHTLHTYNPETERKQAEQYDADMAKMGGGFSSYGTDPRSLACWAVARKCAGQTFTWPPPPNNTPLENTPKAVEMNAAYNKTFVPTCTLK